MKNQHTMPRRMNTFENKEKLRELKKKLEEIKRKEEETKRINALEERSKSALILNNISLAFQNVKIFPSTISKLTRVQGKKLNKREDIIYYNSRGRQMATSIQ